MAPDNTCHKHRSAEDPPGLFQNGDAVFQAHHVGWIICGCFTAVAAVASFWLIDKHLQWYTNKREQRYIVRLLFLVPIYAVISFASFLFWNNATPLILVRDAYEAIVLTAFFYLLLVYLSPDPEEQRRIFLKAGLSKGNDIAARQRGEKLQRWMFPLGFIKKKPKDGLFFLQLMKWGVLQYCVIRPTTTLAAVILDYAGYYCESSWSPVWGHIWIVLIISISVTVAMYCLIQLYLPVSKELKPHRPLLKLFSVKAVVFLTFWQATLLGALSMLGVVKGTRYMTAEDINIGIGAILECFEMMLFAFVHIKAFSYKPYRPFYNPQSKDLPPSRTPRLRSLGHALDFRETFREIWIGCIYLFDKLRGKEPRPDFGARRAAHYEGAFGQPRPSQPKNKAADNGRRVKKPIEKLTPTEDITINQQVEVEVAGERQWLGLGDDYGYGLGYFQRERSEALSTQIEQELQKRGYPVDHPLHVSEGSTPQTSEPQLEREPNVRRRERSWWRNIYDRISQTGYTKEVPDNSLTPSLPRRLQSKARSRRQSEAHHNLLHEADRDPEDPLNPLHPEPLTHIPLPSFHRITPCDTGSSSIDERDVLAPLNTYRDRRRSYKPKRHRNSGSASSLLPQQPLGPAAPPSPLDSSIDIGDLDPRIHDHRNTLLSSKYNRTDSLFNRIFPPSEVGSLEGRSRVDTDSAYSLPSVSNEAPIGQQGDRRRHVHENIYHPSHSAHALHTPWTADILHHHPDSPGHDASYGAAGTSATVSAETVNTDYGQPPPLPAKDIKYVPSFRRPPQGGQSRDHSSQTPRPIKPTDSGTSLPSLPEHTNHSEPSFKLIPPHPPYLAQKSTSTDRSLTLVDTPTSPQSAYFSDNRSSLGSYDSSDPGTPHGKAIGRMPSSEMPPPPPMPTAAVLAAYEDSYTRRYGNSMEGSSNRPISVATDSVAAQKTPSSHRRERAEKGPTGDGYVDPQFSLPLPRPRNPPRSRLPVDSDDFSEVGSLNTFYTASSRPSSTHTRHS